VIGQVEKTLPARGNDGERSPDACAPNIQHSTSNVQQSKPRGRAVRRWMRCLAATPRSRLAGRRGPSRWMVRGVALAAGGVLKRLAVAGLILASISVLSARDVCRAARPQWMWRPGASGQPRSGRVSSRLFVGARGQRGQAWPGGDRSTTFGQRRRPDGWPLEERGSSPHVRAGGRWAACRSPRSSGKAGPHRPEKKSPVGQTPRLSMSTG